MALAMALATAEAAEKYRAAKVALNPGAAPAALAYGRCLEAQISLSKELAGHHE